MKILMINKFLYPNGGSETYMFKLGEELERQGHSVQYFGMEHEGRCVGNSAGAYTSEMDFHNGSVLAKLTYPVKTIYSAEARRKLRAVLDDFAPDVCHLNNFNYQLTPSILLEIKKWRKENGQKCRIVYTAHDAQLICPNHMLYNLQRDEKCYKCVGGQYIECLKNKCIHDSIAKSAVGSAESYIWHGLKVYDLLDKIICPSSFIAEKLNEDPILKNKTVVLKNFIEVDHSSDEKEYVKPELGSKLPRRYVLYFGRLSPEKGIDRMIEACNNLSDVLFVFAGSGPLVEKLDSIPNIKYVGFCDSLELRYLITHADFTVCPSKWDEIFGLSVAESIAIGTPVIAARTGAIPENVIDGTNAILYNPHSSGELAIAMKALWNSPETIARLKSNCSSKDYMDLNQYIEKITDIYRDV